jgi:hypothetical protein
MDLPKIVPTSNDYMWTQSSQFHGNWLVLETINKGPHGSSDNMCDNIFVFNYAL